MLGLTKNSLIQESMKEALVYLIQNCQTALEELKRLNTELNSMQNTNSQTPGINRIGSLHRMIQDYLIVRVECLFDKDPRAASFENLCPQEQDYLILKKESIIKYLIDLRHNFSAHANLLRMQNSGFPKTNIIIESNLNEVLQKLSQITQKY